MYATFLMLAKELRVMTRDRRLMVGVVLSSLVVLPALMGFLTNIDRLLGSDEQPVHVLLAAPLPELEALLAAEPGWVLHRGWTRGETAEGAESELTLERQGDAVRILVDGSRRRLARAARELRDLLEAERQRLFAAALGEHGLTPEELQPFSVELVDTAPDSRSRLITSTLVPYLVVILLVANANRALYVAVGEKERKTLSSLLVSTAPRGAIVVGKSLAIVVFALFSSALLILGLVLFSRFGLALGPAMDGAGFRLSPGQVVEVVPNVMALALFIASVVMLLGTLARSQREAGIYTAPLTFIAIFLAVFSMSSSEFSLGTYAVPILGNSLAMRETLLDSLSPLKLLLAVACNLLLFAALVWVSVRLYHREEVLFRP
ncbi:MAG TPA: ABC transporter permease [Thermoanaerobaculia bacterium]|jgi:sodium transport system permease protein